MTDLVRPAVTLFALGGTIAAPVDTAGSNAKFTLSAADITAAVPQIAEVADVTAVSFLTVPSAGLTFDDLISLAIAIDEAADAGATGIVVTQGTDTLEETAWLLDNLVGSDIPVVVTGAMRNVGKPGADGPANLLAAVQVAVSDLAVGIGTLVVFNDEVHAARSVVKTHSSSPATFRSPGSGALGWITEGRVRIPFVPRRRTPRIALHSATAIPTVALVRLVLDDDGSLIEHLIRSSHSGVIVEVFGGGHVPANLVPALARLAAAKVVVFSSRTGAGELYRAVGDFPGSEQDLLANGLISAVILNGPKARVLLRLLLATGATRRQITDAFADTVL
ncbi:asparaginase [soil metagenome]